MESLLCRFGDTGCGVEDFFAIIGFMASVAMLLAAIAYGYSYINASRWSKPVVESQDRRIDELEKQDKARKAKIDAQDDRIKDLTELVTQAAKVDLLRTSSDAAHAAQLSTLGHIVDTLDKMNLALTAIARKVESSNEHLRES